MAGGRWATFDCYGTLVDWLGGMRAAIASVAPDRADRLLAAYHEEEPAVQAEGFRRYREVLAEALARAAAREHVALAPGQERVLGDTLPAWPVFEDVPDALNRLHEDGWRIALLSNVDEDLVAGTIPHLGAPVDAVVTAERVGSYKPAPGHFETFRSEYAPEHWVHVAQSLFHDIEVVAPMGIPSVWINRQGEPDPGIATVTLPDVRRLPETLARL
jgi:2-haloacid dehalogenase